MRLRYVRPLGQEPAPWREIIGVVDDLGMNVVDPDKTAGVYHVVAHGELALPHLAVRVAGDPESFVPRLRGILNDIEPGIVLDRPVPLSDVFSIRL